MLETRLNGDFIMLQHKYSRNVTVEMREMGRGVDEEDDFVTIVGADPRLGLSDFLHLSREVGTQLRALFASALWDLCVKLN